MTSEKISESRTIHEMIFSEADAYFSALLQDIDGASVSVHLETYIFDFDFIGRQVIEHLVSARLRGVNVKLIIDGAGSASWGESVAEQLEQSGVQVRIFRPLPWKIGQWKWERPHSSWTAKLQHLWDVATRRNHRKMCLIDHRIAWIGSFNISATHLPEAEGGKGWRDTAVRVEGISIDDLELAFENAWIDDAAHFKRKMMSTFHFRLNDIRRTRLRRDLLHRMSQCRFRIWITCAYFVPALSVLRTLKKAGRNKVDVRLLVAGSSDIIFIPWAAAAFYMKLLASGVRIFEYQERILHAKVMILDDWMTVGSTNLDYLSFFRNYEADVVLNLPESKRAIEEQFVEDISRAREIFLQDLPKMAWWKKFFGHLLYSMKRWL